MPTIKKPYSLTPIKKGLKFSDIQINVLNIGAHGLCITRANMKDLGENLRPKTFLTKSLSLRLASADHGGGLKNL